MNSLRWKSLLEVSAVLAVAALVYYLRPFESLDPHAAACAAVTQIANDGKKMNYVRSWIASRTSNQEFMSEIRRNPYFTRSSPRLPEFIDLDWAYLGFNPRYVSFSFNVGNSAKPDFDAGEIGSVSIGYARSMIIVRLNDSKDLGLPWPKEALSELRRISDDVFVHCSS